MNAALGGLPAEAASSAHPSDVRPSNFWTLALGSLGVVYGDIGTSPLYALKESLTAAAAGGAVTHAMVFGIVSLILWALIVIVTIKYVLFILRADNNGEGGTLTLMALAQRALGHNVLVVTLLGMAGAALFYGDAIITPAISVLSAVEGLTLITPAFTAYVLPLSLLILVGLFAVQSHGTARVATWFGPITGLWFVLMAIGGIVHIWDHPGILLAISPVHGMAFLSSHGWAGLFALGAVFLIAVTGTMVVTAVMAFVVVWKLRKWPLWLAVSVVAPFLLVDLIFLAANALKIPQGGWMPLMVGAMLVALAGCSISRRRRSSCRVGPFAPRPGPPCRSGRTSFSSLSPDRPVTRRSSSTFRPVRSSRSARRSRFDQSRGSLPAAASSWLDPPIVS